MIKLYNAEHLFGGNREKAIKRDNEACVQCGMTRERHLEKYGMDISVDHIDRLGINVPTDKRNNQLDNLQTLCLPCHGRKSFVDSGRNRSEHGMLSMYKNHKCRCNLCRASASLYDKAYRLRTGRVKWRKIAK